MRAGSHVVHICSFTVGIDELKRKEQLDPVTVLRFLAEMKRFSVFEATANQTIALTMSFLDGRFFKTRPGGGYPWLDIDLTREGRAAVAADEELQAKLRAERKGYHPKKAGSLTAYGHPVLIKLRPEVCICVICNTECNRLQSHWHDSYGGWICAERCWDAQLESTLDKGEFFKMPVLTEEEHRQRHVNLYTTLSYLCHHCPEPLESITIMDFMQWSAEELKRRSRGGSRVGLHQETAESEAEADAMLFEQHHKMLDELCSDWLICQPRDHQQLFSNTPLTTLIAWAKKQTEQPDLPQGG